MAKAGVRGDSSVVACKQHAGVSKAVVDFSRPVVHMLACVGPTQCCKLCGAMWCNTCGAVSVRQSTWCHIGGA
eukprot:9244643-Pyramimonas_sp.AAC.1